MPAEALALPVTGLNDTSVAAAAAAAIQAKRRRRWRLVGSYLVLTVGAIIVLFPLYITIVNSLLEPSQLAQRPPPLIPLHPQFHDYRVAWDAGHMSSYMVNSIAVTAMIVAGQIVTSVLAGYAFAFLRFPFRNALFVVFLITLMIPFEVTFITNLSTVISLGWFNTLQGLAVPFLATGFGTFLLRQAFLGIPKDLQEAAQLDGYGHWRFMLRVAVPLARPSIAALAVFAFVSAWNQYLWPLVATGGNSPIYTVQLGLKQLYGTQADQIPVALAGAVIAFVPLIILLLIFQKQLVRSLTAGAVR
ncbi:MAG TPA: carbohydrate ABC transporter permease [Acidimicrobiales bacterium]|nr:carbohydrate ABC transporter permease [Acidimicrobiales bacterium]